MIRIRSTLLPIFPLLAVMATGLFPASAAAFPAQIIVLRHGEKDFSDEDNHNLNSAGLQRSLALPGILLKRFGTPTMIFAPAPVAPHGGNLRSLQTISPTAIEAKVNIDTSFGVGEETKLAAKILGLRDLDGKVVFITWEHKAIGRLVEALGAPRQKKWPEKDFDTLLILTQRGGTVTLVQDSEGFQPSSN